ncbi:MAG: hypothetical protein ACMG6E_01815 [Candidatus Roizmanbacteria bacterium]
MIKMQDAIKITFYLAGVVIFTKDFYSNPHLLILMLTHLIMYCYNVWYNLFVVHDYKTFARFNDEIIFKYRVAIWILLIWDICAILALSFYYLS